MERTERLLSLLASLLDAKEPVPFEHIKAWFPGDYDTANPESGARKFERDKAELLDLGVPLEYLSGEDGEVGYRIDRRRLHLRPIELNSEEAAVTVLAGSALLAEQDAFPYRDELRVALGKLMLGSAPGDAPSVVLHPVVRGGVEQGRVLEVLADALARRKRLTFTYRTRYSGQTGRRKVDPYGLYCRLGKWTLVGHAHERGAVRAFLVERISALRANPARPRTPDFVLPADFHVRDHATVPAWRYEAHDPVRVQIAMQRDYAWLGERHFGVTGVPRRRDVLLSVDASNADAIVEWVLSMAPHAVIISPGALRARLRAELRAILRRHGAG